jgi:site-specific recombinase XerD
MYVKEDTLLLKKFLGHESVSSTQIYTHIHDLKIKEAVEKNPLSNFIVDKKIR